MGLLKITAIEMFFRRRALRHHTAESNEGTTRHLTSNPWKSQRMKTRNSIKLCFFLLYSVLLLFLGAFLYKHRTDIFFYFDPPLDAEYVMHDAQSRSFVFSASRYGRISLPYAELGATPENARIIDALLAGNKISYVAILNKHHGCDIYLAHSGKEVLLNPLFQFIFASGQEISAHPPQ